ncbi:MAG TPA: tetratricopeptide repeat protein [Pyrinomonadaceae bacterium]|nr:tetratricopeptide repeat protein [Pyrinomonadaceae bacterium]
MKNSAVILFILIFALTVFSQKPKPAKKPTPTPAKNVKKETPPVNPLNEKEEFDKAVAITDATERIAALQKFLKDFPESSEKITALELISRSRAAIADEKLRLSDTESGIEFFKLAVKDAPKPASDKFFSEVLLMIPNNVFWRGERTAAAEIAKLIEEKSEGNSKQLLGLASFYLGTENASEAQRLANKALTVEPNLPNAYQTLGLAYRMNFQLEESAAAYQKALELDENSVISKRSLAEMKRAVGKPEESIKFYREILAANADDQIAQSGLALALFDAEKKTEAEAEMNMALEANPNNYQFLVGAAYWYAAHNDGAKAVELAQKAVDIEPRYTWAHIALARGFLLQNKPLEAEKTLLIARQYGNFPTLDYEIATARLHAGFFREAAEELSKSFRVENDSIKTNLGGRVSKESKTFIELLAAERRASIFQPLAADDPENANKIRVLLELNQKLNDKSADETAIVEAVDNFVKGNDKMKLHRELFVANMLLQKRIAPTKALEIAQSAVGNTDSALEVADASAAVLADELYEKRLAVFSQNQYLLVPAIPRQTLSAILRGRIEELVGWSLYQQNKNAEAAIRLKRAISVLPEKSAWWRSSLWRLGNALEADGKEKDALDSYIKSYPKDNPEGGKYIVIETLYKKLNGTTDGLEAKIGEKPASAFSSLPATETVAQTPEKTAEIPTATPESTPAPKAETTPEIKEEKSAEPTPTPEVKTETVVEKVSPTPESTPETAVSQTPQPTPENSPSPEPTATPLVKENTEPKTEPTPSETQVAEVKTEPVTEKTAEPTTEIKPAIEATPQPTPEVSASPEPTPSANESTEIKNDKPTDAVVSPSPQATPETIVEVKETPTKETEKTSENGENAPKTSASPKPLFEPIIISVPQMSPIKTSSESKETPEKPVEKPADENVISGANRVRVVVEDKLTPKGIEPCPLIVSQENISLLNGGGSIGILVGFEKDGKLSDIEASSSKPQDIDVSFEPEIGAQSGRAFFVIKSISTNTGEFKVIFTTPCAKKEVNVRVR